MADLTDSAEDISEACTGCGVCVASCAFLRKYGDPRKLAAKTDTPEGRHVAYECSLCGLCDAVCPESLRPSRMLLDLRRRAVKAGEVDLRPYKPLLSYERIGRSTLFRLFAVPDSAETVFFPGCTLPGTRPHQTFQAWEYLRKIYPDLGVVLECCSKSSHDLGLQGAFESAFFALRGRLIAAGVRRVIVACPNCHKVFRQYGEGLELLTVYEVLAEHGDVFPDASDERASVLHDPCPLREEAAIHDAVRKLAGRLPCRVESPKRSRGRTLCCGEGGAVGFIAPELAGEWTKRVHRQAGERRIITYCAGCAGFLSKGGEAVHLLDLFFGEESSRPVGFPFTYLARLRLKRRLRRKSGC